jgi:hypothetical protein
VKAIATITALLLAVVVAAALWRAALFDAYSRDFGTLTPAQFESMNARMDLLETIARYSFFALAGADLALIVVAFRKRAFVLFGFGIALALVLALFFLIARAAVGPTMIGFRERRLVRDRVPEYFFCRGNASQHGLGRGSALRVRGLELLVR